MIDDYDFLCGNDFTWVKIALGNDRYHTIRVQAAQAKAIDFSGGLRNLDEIIIDRCPKFTQIVWPDDVLNIKRLKIGNSASLAQLDLSSLVNLEVLSIINCNKLATINGLGKQLKFINIQGSNIGQLDLSSSKEIKKVIVTTEASTLKINCSACNSLQSAIIHVDGIADNEKEKDGYKKIVEQSAFLFADCSHLNTLKIAAEHAPVDLNIRGCSNLTTSLLSLGNNVKITGELAVEYSATDFANKVTEIEKYIAANKKNALRMPQNPDDLETIIQENGAVGRRNRACLVKLQLLMKAKKNDYLYKEDEYVVKQSNLAIETVNLNNPSTKNTYQERDLLSQYAGVWLRDYFDNENKKIAVVENKLVITDSSSKGSFITNLFSELSYPLVNMDSHFNKIKKPEFYFFEQHDGLAQKGIKNTLPLNFKKNNQLYKENILKKNYPFYYYFNLDNYKKHLHPLTKNNLKKQEEPAIQPKHPQTVGSIQRLFNVESEAVIGLAENNPLFDRERQEDDGFDGAEKVKRIAAGLEKEPELTTCDNPASNLSLLDEGGESKDLAQAERIKAESFPLIAAAECANNENSKLNLTVLDEKQTPVSQGGLFGAEKVKKAQRYLRAEPGLTSPDNRPSDLSILDFKEIPSALGTLTGDTKSGAESGALPSEAVLATYEKDSSGFETFEMTAGAEDAINFEFHVVRALVDLKPRDFEDSTDDFLVEFNSMLIKRLNDLSWLPECCELIKAEKLRLEAEHLIAPPQLTSYEQQNTFLSVLEIKDIEALTAVEKGKTGAEHLVAEPQLTSDESLKAALTSLKIKAIKQEANEKVGNEEMDFEFHVARALVDLKPRDTNLSDDFVSSFLSDLSEQILKQVNELPFSQDYPAGLSAVSKTKAQADYLQEPPQLISYETQESFLRVLEIKEELALEENIDLEYWIEDDREALSDEDELAADFFFEAEHYQDSYSGEEFESLKELLLECDLLDDVLNDETGTLLPLMMEKLRALQSESLSYEVDSLESWDDSQEIESFETTTDFDSLDLSDSELLVADRVMSDEMLALLDSLSDEERDLLFPEGVDAATNSVFFDTLEQLSQKPGLEINLKWVDEENTKRLLQFFANQTKLGIKAWKKGEIYTFEDGTEFTFKNDVFQRLRKDGHEGLRYEAVSNKAQLGEGGFGKVLRIKGTIAVDEEQEALHFKKQGKDGKRRVVKVQNHSEFSNPLANFQKGFALAKRAAHLAIKEPTVVESSLVSQTSYTVMDEISGRELFDIIADDEDGIDVLSTDERIELTRLLLLALAEQVYDQGLIHRDIKPENILVDLGPPIVVKIIDYDLSIETPDGEFAGTEGYYAPEIESAPMSTSAKSDVYSMGRVIALIWRVSSSTYYGENYNYTPSLYAPEDILAGIFNGISDLSEDEQFYIETTLTGMLAIDPEQRFSIDEALENFALVSGSSLLDDTLETSDYAEYSEPEFNTLDSLGDEPLLADRVISDDMLDLLDSLSDEEREMLFPEGIDTATNSALFETFIEEDIDVLTTDETPVVFSVVSETTSDSFRFFQSTSQHEAYNNLKAKKGPTTK